MSLVTTASLWTNEDNQKKRTPTMRRTIKIKPNILISIYLYYNGNNFIDYENNNMNSLLFIDTKLYQNKVYRCYPHNDRFIIGEIRHDKIKPHKNSIIINICNLLKYKYTLISVSSISRILITHSSI